MRPENCWWRPINHHIGHTRAQTSSTNNSQCGKIKSRNGVVRKDQIAQWSSQAPVSEASTTCTSQMPHFKASTKATTIRGGRATLSLTFCYLPATSCRRPLRPSDLEEEKPGEQEEKIILLICGGYLYQEVSLDVHPLPSRSVLPFPNSFFFLSLFITGSRKKLLCSLLLAARMVSVIMLSIEV